MPSRDKAAAWSHRGTFCYDKLMKKQTKPTDRWTNAARGEVQARRLGKPKGELNEIIHMGEEWSKIPNTLFEDAAGQLRETTVEP